jgi:hypothetical protein
LFPAYLLYLSRRALFQISGELPVISLVPNVPKPNTIIVDYRRISILGLLKAVVSKWVLPSLPAELIDDQFGFCPTGSTECALAFLHHPVASMLETPAYMHYL